MRQAIIAEIEGLHRFFEEWFAGTETGGIERLEKALSPGFYLVSPDGSKRARDHVIESVRSARGSGAIRIWIENPDLAWEQDDVVLATYEEWQERGGETRGRLSSALFEKDDGAPGGVRWVAVHETWMG